MSERFSIQASIIDALQEHASRAVAGGLTNITRHARARRAWACLAETIRILMADDHAIACEGLRALFATKPDIELVGEAADGVQAVS